MRKRKISCSIERKTTKLVEGERNEKLSRIASNSGGGLNNFENGISIRENENLSSLKPIKSLKRSKIIENEDCAPKKKKALSDSSRKIVRNCTSTTRLLASGGIKSSKSKKSVSIKGRNVTSARQCSKQTPNHSSNLNLDSSVLICSPTIQDNAINKEGGKKIVKNRDKKNLSLADDIDSRLASTENIDITKARNIIKLFDEGNTIPFLARYRSNLIGNLEPAKLRKIKASYEYIKEVDAKAKKLIQQIPCDDALEQSFKAARSLEELDFLAAPFKNVGKKTLAQQAKDLNLEPVAIQILEGREFVSLEKYVKPGCEKLKTIEQVKLGIQHVIADVINKDLEIHSILLKIVDSGSAILKCKEKNSAENKSKSSKYGTYKNFSQLVKFVKPHQMMAIARGEAENELSAKIEIPIGEWSPVKAYCRHKWLRNDFSKKSFELREDLIMKSADDAIKRLLGPFVVRRIRSKLNKEAEMAAIGVFEANLKQLLLTPPCRGKIIMGIDPGFRHGCKFAVISKQGTPLGWSKFFLPQSNQKAGENACDSGETILKDFVRKFRCDTIAIGNGTACRETEAFLAGLIKNGVFEPLHVSYTIISEQGVSIYSCSPQAKEEFPDLDPFFVGAVSLARRLQDPLSELVKVEPKHLGVGLYQHDVKNARLVSALEEIVSECVSLVGVDVNTASFYLLKRVAGLNEIKAREMIRYRDENCGFRSLEDLKKVKGVKEKTFLQCAGFLRITKSAEGWEINPLDQTIIHPESYDTAISIAKKLKVDVNGIGSESFIENVRNASKFWNFDDLAEEFGVPETEIRLIMETFVKPVDDDIRNGFSGPIYRREVMAMEEIKAGQELTGIVKNVVPFGAFVDLGISTDGLIHSSKMGGQTLTLNDKVIVRVISVDLKLKRIALMLKQKIT